MQTLPKLLEIRYTPAFVLINTEIGSESDVLKEQRKLRTSKKPQLYTGSTI
jgi:hypothetical protein